MGVLVRRPIVGKNIANVLIMGLSVLIGVCV